MNRSSLIVTVMAGLSSFVYSRAIAQGKNQLNCARVAIVEGYAVDSNGELLVSGLSLPSGARIRTEKESKVKLLLKDESIIDVGPSSHFNLTSCDIKKGVQEINLELEFGLIRASVVKNLKNKNRNFKVKTPTSVLGVRGTEFYVDWKKDEYNNVSEQISVTEGQIVVSSLFDSVNPAFKLESGSEFRAEGLLTFQGRERRIESGSPARIDQFNSREQKEIENRVKIESKVLEKEVDLSAKNQKGSRVNEKTEKIVVAIQRTFDDEKAREPQSVRDVVNNTAHLIPPGSDGVLSANNRSLSNLLSSGNLPFYSLITVGVK